MTNYQNYAVLWDMDGVLVDTGDFHFQSWKETFDELDISFTRENFRKTFGMNNAGILEWVFGREPEPEEVSRISDKKESLFRDLVKGKAEPLPGVLTWLEQFHNRGFKQAITSSAPPENIDVLIAELNIEAYFDEIVSGFDLPGKPNPDVFLKAARKLKILPKKCIVVEDAIAGVEGAKRAGMKCIAVTTTNTSETLSKADLIFDSLEELEQHTLFELIENTTTT